MKKAGILRAAITAAAAVVNICDPVSLTFVPGVNGMGIVLLSAPTCLIDHCQSKWRSQQLQKFH